MLQYYHVLHQSPEHVHRFYQEESKIGRPARDGAMGISHNHHLGSNNFIIYAIMVI